jgi:hypothetical protein
VEPVAPGPVFVVPIYGAPYRTRLGYREPNHLNPQECLSTLPTTYATTRASPFIATAIDSREQSSIEGRTRIHDGCRDRNGPGRYSRVRCCELVAEGCPTTATLEE